LCALIAEERFAFKLKYVRKLLQTSVKEEDNEGYQSDVYNKKNPQIYCRVFY
jgi:hypothetical protein